MKLRQFCVLFAFLLEFSFTAFGRRASLNTFAVNKVFTSASNTVVCVPWSGYATNEPPQLAINKLVNSMNLKSGDRLYACTGDCEKYDAWALDGVDKGQPIWKQLKVVTRRGQGSGEPFGITNGVMRGTGLWVVRNTDVEADPVPLYLHGQYATNGASVAVSPGTMEKPSVILLADPDYTSAKNVNEMVDWSKVNVGANDLVSIPSATGGMEAIRHLAWDGQKWYFEKRVEIVSEKTGKVKWGTEKVTEGEEVTVPAGTGFWYQRLSGENDVTVEFDAPSFAQSPAGQE